MVCSGPSVPPFPCTADSGCAEGDCVAPNAGPTPTPTRGVGGPEPTTPGGSDNEDDGCAVGSGADASALPLLGFLAIVALRRRSQMRH